MYNRGLPEEKVAIKAGIVDKDKKEYIYLRSNYTVLPYTPRMYRENTLLGKSIGLEGTKILMWANTDGAIRNIRCEDDSYVPFICLNDTHYFLIGHQWYKGEQRLTEKEFNDVFTVTWCTKVRCEKGNCTLRRGRQCPKCSKFEGAFVVGLEVKNTPLKLWYGYGSDGSYFSEVECEKRT